MAFLIIKDQTWAPWLIDWVNERNEFTIPSLGTKCIANVDFHGENIPAKPEDILFVAALHNWKQFSCEITLVSNGTKKQKATQEYIYEVLNFVFNTRQKFVLEAYVKSTNIKSQAVADKVGMKKVCEIPSFFGADTTAFYYILTREMWLNGKFSHKETIH